MANNLIQIKRTSVPGRAANTTTLPNPAELALNMADQILYSTNGETIFEIGANVDTQVVRTALYVGSNVDVTTAGLFIGNDSVNLTTNATSIKLSNSSVNTHLVLPSTSQYSATNYFLHANGSWVQVVAGETVPTRVYQSFTATASQTIFAVTGGYNIGQIDVYYNGAHLANTEYSEDGSNVTLGTGAIAGAIVEVAGYKDINIVEIEAVPAGGNTEVQFNDSGVQSASAGFTFDKDTDTVAIANALHIGTSTVNLVANSTALKLANSTVNTHITIPTTTEYSGEYYLHANGSWAEVAGADPGGSNTYVQFNDSTGFGGSAAFTFNKDTNNVLIANTLTIGASGNTVNSTVYTGKAYTANAANSATYVLANNGIISNSQGVWVNGNTGITVNSSGVFAFANQGLIANATGIHVLANSGIVSNSTGTFVKQANGTSVDAGGVNVNVATTSGLVSNTTGVWIIANSGLLTNATGLHVGTGNGMVIDTDGIRVLANTGIIVNATGVFVNATYIGTLSANNASYLGGTAAADYALDTDLDAYQTEAGLSANVATLTANNANNLNGHSEAYFANVTTPTFTTSVNVGANVQVNTTALFVGNSSVNVAANSSTLQILDTGWSSTLESWRFTIKQGATTVFFIDNDELQLGNSSFNTWASWGELSLSNGTITNYLNSGISKLGNSTCNVTSNSTSIKVGSNVIVTTADLTLGNTSVNLVANSISIKLANSTVNTQIVIPTTTEYSGNYFLHANGTWQTPPGGGLGNVVEDTTPQLGGDLDLNSHGISANGGVGGAGEVLKSNGSSAYWGTVSGGAPGGANTYVLINDSGAANGTAGFVFDKDSNTVTIANTLIINHPGDTESAFLVNASAISTKAAFQLSIPTTGEQKAFVINRVGESWGFVSFEGNLQGSSVGPGLALGLGSAARDTFIWRSGTGVLSTNSTIDISGNTINSTVWTGKSYTANDSTNLGGLSAANYANLSSATFTSGVYPSSNTIPLGDSTHRWVITANSISLTGAVTSTGFTANSLGVYANSVVNAASLTVGTDFIANSTQLTITGKMSANGGLGSATQVLTSNSTGGAYWSTPSGGAPGGSNTYILINDSGVVNGTAAFTFDKNTNTVAITETGKYFAGNSSVNTVVSSIGMAVAVSPTANLTSNSTIISLANSSGTANLQPTQLVIGGSIVNSTTVAVGANTIVSNSVISSGGSLLSANVQINPQTDTYSLVASDSGKVIPFTNASAKVITIPASLPVGFRCAIVRMGAGTLTLSNTGSTGLNMVSRTSAFAITAQYGSASVFMANSTVAIVDGSV